MSDEKDYILDDIGFELDVQSLMSKVRVAEGSEDDKAVKDLANSVASKIKPKAVCKVVYVQDRTDNSVNVGGVVFTSKTLRANLDKAERVFAYIATCGNELEKTDIEPDDYVKQFWLDAIKEMALRGCIGYLKKYIKKRYALKKISAMQPGSGDQDLWPIEQQKLLFSLFGNTEELIGVTLTDSCLMVPNKSLSGIYFPTEFDFTSCQMCHREKCPGRLAPCQPPVKPGAK